MKIDQAIQEQLARSMSEPMIDPRLGRMADPISTPTQRSLNDVMTPQPFQAPSLADIRNMQTASLDRMFGTPSDLSPVSMCSLRNKSGSSHLIILFRLGDHCSTFGYLCNC